MKKIIIFALAAGFIFLFAELFNPKNSKLTNDKKATIFHVEKYNKIQAEVVKTLCDRHKFVCVGFGGGIPNGSIQEVFLAFAITNPLKKALTLVFKPSTRLVFTSFSSSWATNRSRKKIAGIIPTIATKMPITIASVRAPSTESEKSRSFSMIA